jgi:apolipoprotein N-acyltransferase
MLICRKAGNPPGILVWLPVLQSFPLLRAAGMSGWWFLAVFVPVLNLVPAILWPFKIAKARGKSVWVGVLLLLPVTNYFAFLYLAFSNGARVDEDEEAESKIMSLQAA